MIRSNSKDLSLEPLISHHQVERPIHWNRYFKANRPLDVEIGFGLGEFLIRSALEAPERNFVGIEMDWPRVKKTLRKVHRHADQIQNVRILKTDAWVAFLRLFFPQTIDRIYSLFPCPWPKKKHIKYRLFSNEFLKLLNSRLKDQGTIKIVTDYYPYLLWILDEAKNTGFHTQTEVIKPHFDTKYERKWREEGQERFHELKLLKKDHIHVPIEKDERLSTYTVEHFCPDQFCFHNVVGDLAIILKDFIFDKMKQKGMVCLVVAEKRITQHLWVEIFQEKDSWRIAMAQGQMSLPTKGVAVALEAVHKTAIRSALDLEVKK